MIHKHDKNKTINNVNYISSATSNLNDGGFLGLLRLNANFNWWGINIADVICCGVYLLKFQKSFSNGDDLKETPEMIKDNPYVLYFKGGDNTSYFLRFITGKDAYDYYQSLDSLDSNEKLMYYNS